MATRTVLIIAMCTYFVIVGAFLSEIGKNLIIESESYQQGVTQTNLVVNITTSISGLPAWANTILLILPAAILAYLIIISFIPTVNAGA